MFMVAIGYHNRVLYVVLAESGVEGVADTLV